MYTVGVLEYDTVCPSFGLFLFCSPYISTWPAPPIHSPAAHSLQSHPIPKPTSLIHPVPFFVYLVCRACGLTSVCFITLLLHPCLGFFFTWTLNEPFQLTNSQVIAPACLSSYVCILVLSLFRHLPQNSPSKS